MDADVVVIGAGALGLTTPLAEFELDETGAVARLVAQPLGIFLPKT
jgi:hypothetical protein